MLVLLLSYDMRKKHICKILNISSRSKLLHIIMESNFESQLQWRIQSLTTNLFKIRRKSLNRPIFMLKLFKKIPGVKTFQLICRMISLFLSKMCMQWLLFLKFNKNYVFSFIKKRVSFIWLWYFFLCLMVTLLFYVRLWIKCLANN